MLYLKYFKIKDDVLDPKFGTKGAACFDVHAYLKPGSNVSYYDNCNVKSTQIVSQEATELKSSTENYHLYNIVPSNSAVIPPNCRMMVPTGIILDIPENYSVRVHSRSSLALKKGLRLANSEGVIDYDYFDPLFVLLHNTTNENVVIMDGERIAQLEMVPMLQYLLKESEIKPEKKTDRVGGFGSTGE